MHKGQSTFNMSLGHALSKELQAALSQVNDFTLVFLLKLGLCLDLAIRDVSDMLNDIIGLTNEANQCLVFRFE